jgi:hypothetical protein
MTQQTPLTNEELWILVRHYEHLIQLLLSQGTYMTEEEKLLRAHPNWRNIVTSRAFVDWLNLPESKPYRRLCNSRKAKDAIHAIDLFKTALAKQLDDNPTD